MNAIAERNPSLLEIEQSLAMLNQDLDEVTDPEERKPLEAALAEYMAKEIDKVDRVRGYIRFAESKVLAAKQAAAEATSYAQIWQNRIERVKAAALTAAQASGKRTFEGTAGSLSVRKNGGLAPLKITDASLLPDDCCRMEGWLPAGVWAGILSMVRRETGVERWGDAFNLRRQPDPEAIRAKLAEPCPVCEGTGSTGAFSIGFGGEPQEVSCAACGGSGKNAVPGAYLAERGTSLVVR